VAGEFGVGVGVSSIEFRNLTEPRSADQADRLLRAAVTAFVALTRPTRIDAARLADLAEPLLDRAAPETLRFAAAALSDSPAAPAVLVRRIANLPVALSAPLIARSPLLTEIDLIALIGRNGLAHARVVARRHDHGPRLAALLAGLPDEEIRAAMAARPGAPLGGAEAMRERLRVIATAITPAETPAAAVEAAPDSWPALREAALSGDKARFALALAAAHDLPVEAAARFVTGHGQLVVALRPFDLAPEQAFLLVAALFPGVVGDSAAIRRTLEDYGALDRARCARIVALERDGGTVSLKAS